MGGHKKSFATSVKNVVALVFLLTPVTQSLNLGLIAGDLKRHSSPLIIRKVSKLAPVFININSALPNYKTSSFPKLPPKPPPLEELVRKPSKKLPRSILSPLPKLPLLTILPIIPPLLPPLLPILPKIPLLPLPILPSLPLLPYSPLIPNLKSPIEPLRVPIIKRSPLKDLESELKMGKVPLLKKDNKKDGLQKKLFDLKKKGFLTTAEYITFRKLLLT